MSWVVITALFTGVLLGDVAVEVFAETSASSFLLASDNWFWSFPSDPTTSHAAMSAEQTLNEDEYLRQLCGPVTPFVDSVAFRDVTTQ